MTVTRRISFMGSMGAQLAARYDEPKGESRGDALFAHCFTCSKDLAAATRIARALNDRGFGVLRFDFTGLGHSDGEFANTNFSSNVADIHRAVNWMRERGHPPRLLMGHSLGGAAVLAAASEIPELRAVATIAAPSEPAHLSHLFEGAMDELRTKGEACVLIAGRRFTIKEQLLDDIASSRLAPKIRAIEAAVLIFHSPEDEVVELEHATRIFQLARHPKSFVALPGADHLLTRKADAEYVAEVTAAWASRYMVD